MSTRSDAEWEAEWETDDEGRGGGRLVRPPRLAPLVAMRRHYMQTVQRDPTRNVEKVVDQFM